MIFFLLYKWRRINNIYLIKKYFTIYLFGENWRTTTNVIQFRKILYNIQVQVLHLSFINPNFSSKDISQYGYRVILFTNTNKNCVSKRNYPSFFCFRVVISAYPTKTIFFEFDQNQSLSFKWNLISQIVKTLITCIKPSTYIIK